MQLKRHTLSLALTCLSLAGGAAAQTAPGYPELFDQASNTASLAGQGACRGAQRGDIPAALKCLQNYQGGL